MSKPRASSSTSSCRTMSISRRSWSWSARCAPPPARRRPRNERRDRTRRHGRTRDGLQFRLSRRADEADDRSEEHTSELQSRENLVCRLLLEKKKKQKKAKTTIR